MKSIFLESGHIKLYKRENSQYWQMKLKLPKQRAIRSSTGSKILKEAKKIALKNYSSFGISNKIKKKLDQQSAAYILQGYLDKYRNTL